MEKMPSGTGACCLPNVAGITYIQIGPQGHTVGMMGLDTVVQQLYAMGRRPEDATDEELVGMARKFNWIAKNSSLEADYAAALRQVYAAFFNRQEKKA
ncbi:MAG TPA: hypothetical protein VLA49_03570 [Anaerolineales bacterium]|nr:hypothetical protein [Anaerolineales bacterium]